MDSGLCKYLPLDATSTLEARHLQLNCWNVQFMGFKSFTGFNPLYRPERHRSSLKIDIYFYLVIFQTTAALSQCCSLSPPSLFHNLPSALSKQIAVLLKRLDQTGISKKGTKRTQKERSQRKASTQYSFNQTQFTGMFYSGCQQLCMNQTDMPRRQLSAQNESGS